MANLDARKRRKNQGRDGTSEIQCARPATPRFALSNVQDTWSNVNDSQARKLRRLTIVDQGVNAYDRAYEVLTPEYLIHETTDKVNILIADLDKNRSCLGEQFSGDHKPIAKNS